MRRATRFLTVLAFLALDAHGAINMAVHKIAKDLTGAEITALATSGYNSTAGNLIVVWTATYSGAQPVGFVTDSAGDTFVPASLNKSTWYGQWFYAKNVKGDPFNVVTIHPATTGRATLIYPGMNVMEFSGADPSAPLVLDLAGTQGALTAWTSKPFDVSAGELVLLGIATANGGAYNAGPGFKLVDAYLTPASNKFSFAALQQISAAAQTGVTAGVTWTGTFQATGAVVSFKPAP